MKFKRKFSVPTKDFKKSEMVELMVETVPENIEDLIDGAELEYKVKLPDFMFNEVANTEPKFTTTPDINNRETISGCFSDSRNAATFRKFQKTQSSKNLSYLNEYFSELTSFINAKYTDKFIGKNKKIFIKYSYSFRKERQPHNHAYMGTSCSNYFQFFIGEQLLYNTESDLYKNSISMNKRPIDYATDTIIKNLDTILKVDGSITTFCYNGKVSDFEKEYSIIDWTEEREAFCKKIQDTFNKINGELSSFLTNLDNDKFDLLIEQNPLKLLN